MALVTDGTRFIVAHVGDSRAYLWRGRSLRQLTTDHTTVQRLVDGGMLTPEQAEEHPDASVLDRAMGHQPTVQVDVADWRALESGDVLLLCSDGLCGFVPDDEIAAVLSQGGDPQAMVDRLIEAALAKGGADNVTVQLVRYEPPRGRPAALSRTAVLVAAGVALTAAVAAGLAWQLTASYRSEIAALNAARAASAAATAGPASSASATMPAASTAPAKPPHGNLPALPPPDHVAPPRDAVPSAPKTAEAPASAPPDATVPPTAKVRSALDAITEHDRRRDAQALPGLRIRQSAADKAKGKHDKKADAARTPAATPGPAASAASAAPGTAPNVATPGAASSAAPGTAPSVAPGTAPNTTPAVTPQAAPVQDAGPNAGAATSPPGAGQPAGQPPR